jgi:putative colanic acid biosynthesis UDP-glucose lipid carrier transferase
MFGNGTMLRDRKIELLTPVSARLVSSRPSLRPPSAIDLQVRLPAMLSTWDWLGITVIGVLADFATSEQADSRLTHYLAIVLCATAAVNCLHFVHGYCIRGMRRVAVQMAKTFVAWAIAFIGLISIGYVADGLSNFPRLWAGIWFLSVCLFLWATRWTVGLLLSRWQRDGRFAHNVVVIGTGPEAAALAGRLRERREEANVVGVFADGSALGGDGDTGVIAGDNDLLTSLVSSGQVDEVIIASAYGSPPGVRDALAKFATRDIEVKIDPGFLGAGIRIQDFSELAGVPTLTVLGRPLVGWGGPFKRAEDIILTSILLILLMPVLLLIAVLIKLDSPGPVIFRQERRGFHNDSIMVYKFRTMYHRENQDPGVPQARRNDPRVTRFGAWLRRTSVDELPQLFNVLRGDMSLVGPRPHALPHNEEFAKLIDGYLTRHRMKPGITGWAQVNGWRGETDTVEKMQNRLEHDLFYIANWSLLLDIKVLLMTIPVVVRGTNAY